MKKVSIKGWQIHKIEYGKGIDPTGLKALERGTISVDIKDISVTCDRQLLSSAYLDGVVTSVFGEASSNIDRALEAAFAVINDQEKAEIVIEIPGKYVNQSLENENVSLSCVCCITILSNGKSVYEYSAIEVLEIGRIYKKLSSNLISKDRLHLGYPNQLASFFLLERALQWLSLIHPKELIDISGELMLLKRQCYNNMALLQLNFSNFSAVEIAASYVIAEEENNVKALYRRAIANTNLQNYEVAKLDLEIILTLEPSNKAAKFQMDIIDRATSNLDKNYAIAMKKFLNL